jgi:hypothetical protein
MGPTCQPLFVSGPACQAPSSTWSACRAQRATRHKPPQLPLGVRCPKRRLPLHSPTVLAQNAEPPCCVSLGESGERRCAIFFSRQCTTSLRASPSPPNTAAAAPLLFCHARLSSTAPATIRPHRPELLTAPSCRVSSPYIDASSIGVHLPHQRRTLAAPLSRPSAATAFFLDTERLLRPSRQTRSSTRRGRPALELHHRVEPSSTASSPQPRAPSAEPFPTRATAPFPTRATAPSAVIPTPCR